MKKKGFTLVELSIVLVIIGLLVGGILVGQSLIESAKLSSFVSLIAKSDAAVNAFEAKFNGLPGDNKSFGGNGDGFVGRNAAGGSSCQGPSKDQANVLQGEIANFWSNAYQGKYLASPYAPNTSQGIILINNNPNLKKYFPTPNFGTKGSFLYVAASGVIAGSTGSPWCIDNVAPHNYYILAGPDYYSTLDNNPYVLAGASIGKRATTVLEMMSLDTKWMTPTP
jgi:prepilin-type N-terminal cleavage/methylation domain-containing protein